MSKQRYNKNKGKPKYGNEKPQRNADYTNELSNSNGIKPQRRLAIEAKYERSSIKRETLAVNKQLKKKFNNAELSSINKLTPVISNSSQPIKEHYKSETEKPKKKRIRESLTSLKSIEATKRFLMMLMDYDCIENYIENPTLLEFKMKRYLANFYGVKKIGCFSDESPEYIPWTSEPSECAYIFKRIKGIFFDDNLIWKKITGVFKFNKNISNRDLESLARNTVNPDRIDILEKIIRKCNNSI